MGKQCPCFTYTVFLDVVMAVSVIIFDYSLYNQKLNNFLNSLRSRFTKTFYTGLFTPARTRASVIPLFPTYVWKLMKKGMESDGLKTQIE